MHIITIIKRYLKYLLNFGPRITYYYLTYPRFGGRKAVTKRHYEIKRFIKHKFKHILEQYKNKNIDNSLIEENLPIWVCWLQGEEKMPEIVKICYNSILRHSNKRTVNLITSKNIKDFIDIPPFIQTYIKKGKISRTHFADYIRILLLEKYGGLWIDASILVTDDITTELQQPFYSIKQQEEGSIYFVSEYRWAVSLLGCSTNCGRLMFSCLNELFKSYLKQYTFFIDFFLFDYFIATIYEEIPMFRQLIDNNKVNCNNFYRLSEVLNKTYDRNTFLTIKQDNKFHKTSWKCFFREVDDNKNPTFYGHIKAELENAEYTTC